jgi:cyanophycin synthetase
VLLHHEDPADRPAKAAVLAHDLNAWLEVVRQDGLAPNTLRFAWAALARGMPVVTRPGFIQVGWGECAERLDSSFTGRTGNLASRLARDKHQTKLVLYEASIPVPSGTFVRTVDQALQFALAQGWPVVIKPADRDGGVGVVPGIRGEAGLRLAFDAASRLSAGGVVVEQHVDGADHRLLVVDGRLWAAARRTPAGVSGDGIATVAELVERINRDPQRGRHKRSMLMALDIDEEGRSCLVEQGLNAQSVPRAGRFVHLRRIANIGSGGTAEDVMHLVHPDNRALAERAARCIGLDIAGIDFLCPDISRSWMEVGGAICEVNAQPGFRVHWLAEPARDLNGELIDWLFRDKPARIPTAAITGTNGKTTVARMLHHIWLTAGRRAGVCTTQGVWVGQDRLTGDNLSGLPGGRILLNDPSVEVAVTEMPRKGLIRFGHPCDRYDVGALLNLQDDHIGVDGIHSLQAMAELKGEVLERATGAVVVNAEDPLALAMLGRSGAPRRILVASRADVPALRQHLSANGEAFYAGEHLGQPWIVHARGGVHVPLMRLHDVPAWMDGLLRHNAMNALFAAALASAQGVDPSTVRRALATFANTPQHNPGRYNFIEGLPFRVLLDYGHNPDGVAELCAIASGLPDPATSVQAALEAAAGSHSHPLSNTP